MTRAALDWQAEGAAFAAALDAAGLAPHECARACGVRMQDGRDLARGRAIGLAEHFLPLKRFALVGEPKPVALHLGFMATRVAFYAKQAGNMREAAAQSRVSTATLSRFINERHKPTVPIYLALCLFTETHPFGFTDAWADGLPDFLREDFTGNTPCNTLKSLAMGEGGV